MNTRTTRLALAALIVLAPGALYFVQKASSQNLPPGVNQDQWIWISNNARIVLHTAPRAMGPHSPELAGTLMLRIPGRGWRAVYLESHPGFIHPFMQPHAQVPAKSGNFSDRPMQTHQK